MKYVLIGGPADGERHELPEPPSVYRVARTTRESVFDPLNEFISINYVIYRPSQLVAGDRRFTVYVCDNTSPEEAMERLIEGYHGYSYVVAAVADSGRRNLQ